MIRPFLLFCLCVFCLFIDQWSKAVALSHLNPYGFFIWEGLGGLRFSFDLVTNSGTAWGFFAFLGPILVLVRIVLVTGCLFYAAWFLHGKKEQIPLSLITTGALSNIVDYFLYGHVIDFLHVNLWSYDFPVFNIADSLICIGAFIWLLMQITPSSYSSRYDTTSS